MQSNTNSKAKGRDTLMGWIFAMAGDANTTTATPKRAIAISIPMAKAISLPLNHFTIPRETVIPAISAPHPKIIKPMAESFAEAGIPA